MEHVVRVWKLHMDWMVAQMALANKYRFELNNGRRMMLDTVVVRSQLSPVMFHISAILDAGLPAPGLN